tara:strand:- start:2234 stop:2644 length:411 start_codon:yes stop_codon:yes gene_type:complete
MNIKSLIAHVIDKTVDKLTRHTLVDDSFAEKIAYCLNYSAVGECLDYGELAGAIDIDDMVDAIDLDYSCFELCYEKLVDRVDYDLLSAEIAKHRPDQIVGDDPETPCVEGLSNKLLDAAVNKLLTLANSQVELDQV